MRYALPILNGRIAPRPTSADTLLLVDRENAGCRSDEVPLEEPSMVDVVALLQGYGADVFVCCGIDRSARSEIAAAGIEVMENVACSASEAIAAIGDQRLQPGFGLYQDAVGPRRGAAMSGTLPGAGHDGGRVPGHVAECLVFGGKICPGADQCPLGGVAIADEGEWAHTMLDATLDVVLEKERQLCRLSEVVYFCLEMKYRTVGIAFCSDLEEPARIAATVLKRFFTVIGVCCKTGTGHGQKPDRSGTVLRPETESPRPCNPLGQAKVLNRARCDLVIVIGLCVGADCVLTKACKAPVTTLFVKDRVLANNPIGAVYSSRYLKETLRGRPSV
jgi:uncharacterized metal-binding protein/predicted Fe-Mo cluster-binding NifX family protein